MNYDEMNGDKVRLFASRNCYKLSRVSRALLKLLVYTHNIWQTTHHTMLDESIVTTPSIFYAHNIWQFTLHTMLYHTLHPLHLPYTHHTAGNALCHALSCT